MPQSGYAERLNFSLDEPFGINIVRQKMRVVLGIFLAVIIGGCSVRHMDKRATLILPDEVALNGADVDLHPAIEIVWDEDEPVTVDVLRPRGSDGRPQAPMVVGSWKIYDAEGKEVEQAMAQMVWASPDGKLDVAKGSRAKLPFEPNSLYVLSKARAGRYYATAEFSGIFRGAKVRFVTDNRWFTIIREH